MQRRTIQNRTRIYLDNAATTPLLPEARAAMEPYFEATFGNASSPYAVSREARMAIDRARTAVAALIGAQPDEIVFTSGGTESDNWALLGVALANAAERRHVLVSAIEHHAILEGAGLLSELGFEVQEIPCNASGVIETETVAHLLRHDTCLVAVMTVNNETGVVQPVAEISALCRERGVALHTDAVQAAGKTLLFPSALSADLMALSAHKIGGPKGAGALYVRRGTPMRPLLRGGGQERGRRAGTENVLAIAGFGAVAETWRREASARQSHLADLRLKLETGLAQVGGAVINGAGPPRSPHIVNVSVPGLRAESLALQLDLQGIAVGTGSACASGAIEPSHVLQAMGLSREAARSSLRVSLGIQNTREEIAEFLDVLSSLLKKAKVA